MKYFFEHYVFLNLKDYFGEDLDIQPMLWMLFITIGLCIACFCSHVLQNALYTTVKQAVRHKAQDAEHAKTVAELGLSSHRFIRFLLRRSDGRIYRAITRADAEELTYEEYVQREKQRRKNKEKRRDAIDLSTTRFYVSDKTRAYADRLLAAGDAPIYHPIMASLALLLVYVLIALLLPSVLSLFV